MSIQAVAWAISQKVGSPTGKVVLICLANYANEKGQCWPSQKTICKEAELSERSTREWLKKLEAQGFITRSRRHRSDGSRTSDHMVLNLTRTAAPSENNLAADSAARPNQAANGSEPNGSSRRTYRQEVPGIEPVIEPLEEPSSGARERGEAGFEKLWDDWPRAERPQKLKAAKWAYDRLSSNDQAQAVQQAKRFRRLTKAQKNMALMIPYLKQRQFEDLASGPEISPDGKFIFTPDRPEWQGWVEYISLKYSPAAGKRLEGFGKFVDARRWPPKPTLATGGVS
ncbi:MAG: helix-turn-helix domain-containing protein [Robiginitomaculum sp.]|nr:helix-turn-helix domain-containing protein [Robiginitomaculum sp.]